LLLHILNSLIKFSDLIPYGWGQFNEEKEEEKTESPEEHFTSNPDLISTDLVNLKHILPPTRKKVAFAFENL
jgi:hypothetical protein